MLFELIRLESALKLFTYTYYVASVLRIKY